jgi:uncharacterized OB-fold protein
MEKKTGVEESRKTKRRPIKEGLFHEPDSPNGKPYLIGSQCSSCGYVSFPKRPICPMCLEDGTMNEIPLSRKGKINTFTISRVAPLGFKAPYIQAFVDLPEGPRVFSLITGCEASESAMDIGSEVELVIEKICVDEEGGELIGYKFRPV